MSCEMTRKGTLVTNETTPSAMGHNKQGLSPMGRTHQSPSATGASSPVRLLAACFAVLCALTLCLAGIPAPARATDGGASEADSGAKIERVAVAWVTPDTVDDGNPAHLSFAPTGSLGQVISMRLSISLSGEDAYQPGAVRITIPKNILTYRDGSPAGAMTLPYPAAPDDSSEFNYVEDGDSYVLTNTKNVSGASQHEMQFSIRDIVPYLMNGNPDAYTSDPFQAVVEVTTPKGTKLTKASNAIDASIDTSVKLNTSVAEIRPSHGEDDPIVYESWPQGWPEELRPENASDYVFMRWYAQCPNGGNQSYSLEVTADASASGIPGTKILGIQSVRERKTARSGDDGQSVTVNLLKHFLGLDIGFGTDVGAIDRLYLFVAYPKNELPFNVEHTFTQNIHYTLTPADDTDAVSTWDGRAEHRHTRTNFSSEGRFAFVKRGSLETAYGRMALSALQSKKPVDIDFGISGLGFFAPLTWEDANGDGVMDPDEVGKRPIEMTMEDTDLTLGDRKLGLGGDDYEFKYVDFDVPRFYDYAIYETGGNGPHETEIGSVVNGYVSAGSPGYKEIGIEELDQVPSLELSIRVAGGDWEPWAAIELMGSASSQIRYADGTLEEVHGGGRVRLPEMTTGIRGTMRLEASGQVDGADWNLEVPITLKPSEQNLEAIEREFELNGSDPELTLSNRATMNVMRGGESVLYVDESHDEDLHALQTAVQIRKYYSYKNDPAGRQVRLSYSVSIDETAAIPAKHRETYDEMVAIGAIVPETSGTFYELLPPGVVPDIESVSLRRAGDTVRDVELVPNFRDSGRTLMIVRVDLTPRPASATHVIFAWDHAVISDVISLDFEATYSWEELRDRGSS